MWVAVNLTCHHFIMVSCWIYVIFDTKKIRIPLKKRSLLSNGVKKLSSAQWRSSLYSVKLFHIFHIENAEKNVQFLHENDLCPCRLKLLHNTFQCNQVVVQSSHALLLSGTRLESITTGSKHTHSIENSFMNNFKWIWTICWVTKHPCICIKSRRLTSKILVDGIILFHSTELIWISNCWGRCLYVCL